VELGDLAMRTRLLVEEIVAGVMIRRVESSWVYIAGGAKRKMQKRNESSWERGCREN
jgi:hypothetical protein